VGVQQGYFRPSSAEISSFKPLLGICATPKTQGKSGQREYGLRRYGEVREKNIYVTFLP
jgi:hypothetical protein